MTNSYDEKIKRDISRRSQREKQRRARRRQELRKQYAAIAVCLVVLLIIVICLFKSCTSGGEDKNEPTTTAQVATTTTEVVTKDEEPETVEEEAESQQETEINKDMYTTDILNFREKPSTESALLVHIPEGEKVKVLSLTGEWAKIKYKDVTGYVKYEYLSEEKDSEE